MAKLEDLQTAMTALNGAVDQLVTLADAQVSAIQALKDQIAAGNPVTEAQLQELVDSANAEKMKVTDALARDMPTP